jgi:copper chaperone
MSSHTISVAGMSCNHCVRGVRLALEAVEGITITEVAVGSVRVEVPDGASRIGDITAAIEDAGYTVTAVQS